MLGSPILDVLVGVLFVFLILSLLTSAVNEAIVGVLGRRSGFLRKWLRDQLGDDETVKKFYEQPLIQSLGTKRLFRKGTEPSYIRSDLFVTSLFETVLADEVDIAGKQIAAIGNPRIKGVLTSLAGTANETIENVREKAEKWFDAAMERVSGAYKRRTQLWLWGLALVTAVGLNVDTLLVVRTLWTDSSVRDAVVKQADAFLEDNDTLSKEELDEAVQRVRDLDQLQVPIGWAGREEGCEVLDTGCDPRSWPRSGGSMALRVVGWLMTAAALSLGAPFWFDALNKVSRLRSSGSAPKARG